HSASSPNGCTRRRELSNLFSVTSHRETPRVGYLADFASVKRSSRGVSRQKFWSSSRIGMDRERVGGGTTDAAPSRTAPQPAACGMTNIPTELLRTLVAVVDLRSFTKAAQGLGMT